MARLVCPNCGTDEQLYSCEKAEIMYSVRFDAESGEMDYTGDDRIVLDEATEYEGQLYCRSCSVDWQEHELVPGGDD